MPLVKFSADFNFAPNPRTIVAYKKDGEYQVTRACAEEAVLKGKGTLVLKTAMREGALRPPER